MLALKDPILAATLRPRGGWRASPVPSLYPDIAYRRALISAGGAKKEFAKKEFYNETPSHDTGHGTGCVVRETRFILGFFWEWETKLADYRQEGLRGS